VTLLFSRPQMGGRGGWGVDIFGKKTCGQAPLLEQKESTEALILAYEMFSHESSWLLRI
jgi:hypothetical protein